MATSKTVRRIDDGLWRKAEFNIAAAVAVAFKVLFPRKEFKCVAAL